MDLIVEELQCMEKDRNAVDNCNFNLNKFRLVTFYTKWQRNMLNEADMDYFKNIERNKRRQEGLRIQMRLFISKLQIPLYNQMKQVQFHDTLNGLIGCVYKRLHEKYVSDRQQRIQTKLSIGEKLTRWEAIKINSAQFWELRPLDQEILLERTDGEFQKVVNRLENKGNIQSNQIMKLSFMRRLRKQAGRKFSHLLFVYEDE